MIVEVTITKAGTQQRVARLIDDVQAEVFAEDRYCAMFKLGSKFIKENGKASAITLREWIQEQEALGCPVAYVGEPS